MELADTRLLGQLTEAFNAKGMGRRRAHCPRMTTTRASKETVYQGPRRKSRRCLCGACAFCKENERWERVLPRNSLTPTIIPVQRYGTRPL
jgi:hypothetical protein